MADYAWYATGDEALLAVIKGSNISELETAKQRLSFLCGEYMANQSSADLADVTSDPLLDAAAANHDLYKYNTTEQEIQLK